MIVRVCVCWCVLVCVGVCVFVCFHVMMYGAFVCVVFVCVLVRDHVFVCFVCDVLCVVVWYVVCTGLCLCAVFSMYLIVCFGCDLLCDGVWFALRLLYTCVLFNTCVCVFCM